MNTQPTLENLTRILINTKPITQKQLRELNKNKEKPKFPYEDTANILNNLTGSKLNDIPIIIHNAEISVWKKVGIKKLYAMVKNPIVKKSMKQFYNL